jgi:hypothetical protein
MTAIRKKLTAVILLVRTFNISLGRVTYKKKILLIDRFFGFGTFVNLARAGRKVGSAYNLVTISPVNLKPSR